MVRKLLEDTGRIQKHSVKVRGRGEVGIIFLISEQHYNIRAHLAETTKLLISIYNVFLDPRVPKYFKVVNKVIFKYIDRQM